MKIIVSCSPSLWVGSIGVSEWLVERLTGWERYRKGDYCSLSFRHYRVWTYLERLLNGMYWIQQTINHSLTVTLYAAEHMHHMHVTIDVVTCIWCSVWQSNSFVIFDIVRMVFDQHATTVILACTHTHTCMTRRACSSNNHTQAVSAMSLVAIALSKVHTIRALNNEFS